MSVRTTTRSMMAVACVAAAWPSLASARQASPVPPARGDRAERVVVVQAGQAKAVDPVMAARFQLAKMEGLLEVAVQHGAVMMNRQWRSVMPDMLILGGNARAHGFRLDGYGVFFDVEVPALRQSMMWSWRVLDRDSGGVSSALEVVKNHLKTITDPAERRDLDQAVRRLELQVAPLSASVLEAARAEDLQRSGDRVAVPVAEAPPAAGVSGALPMPEDPGLSYTMQVKTALIDTMIDYSQALTIGPDEYLTVAARDNQSQGLPSGDLYDTMTIIIRVKGSDLADFRAGRLSREEALKRVEVKEY